MDSVMEEGEIRANAMLFELGQQRMILGDRAAQLAAELTIARERIKQLERELLLAQAAKKPEAPQ